MPGSCIRCERAGFPALGEVGDGAAYFENAVVSAGILRNLLIVVSRRLRRHPSRNNDGDISCDATGALSAVPFAPVWRAGSFGCPSALQSCPRDLSIVLSTVGLLSA